MLLLIVNLSFREHSFYHLVNKIIWFVIAVRIRVFKVKTDIASSLMPQLKRICTLLEESSED
jgi:hypothetical protein